MGNLPRPKSSGLLRARLIAVTQWMALSCGLGGRKQQALSYSVWAGADFWMLSSDCAWRSIAPIHSASQQMTELYIPAPQNRSAKVGENRLRFSTQSNAPETSAMKNVAANISRIACLNATPPRSKPPRWVRAGPRVLFTSLNLDSDFVRWQ